MDQRRIIDVDCTGADQPEGAELVELGEATLLRGLIDSHTHPVFGASNDPVGHLAGIDDDARLECRAWALAALAAGVTTLRDLGDRRFVTLGLRQKLAAHPEQGPQLLVSGRPVTTSGGLLVPRRRGRRRGWGAGGGAGDGRTWGRRGQGDGDRRQLHPRVGALAVADGLAELGAAVEEAHRLVTA